MVLLFGFVVLAISPLADASSPSSSHVIVYSTYASSSEDLYVPVNSSGISVYPDWHIYLYGAGTFSFLVNGTIAESGDSLGAMNFTYVWNLPGGSWANATLVFAGTTYTFNTIITGPLSNQVVLSVSVSSSYAGQNQFLTASPGTSGALMYPDWHVVLQSTQNVSYTVYVNNQEILSGSVIGSKTVNFNISGSTATVTIGLGNKVFSFPHELISSIPIQKYYGPAPPSLQYTLSQYEYGIARAFVASIFAVMIALFTARKYLLEKEKREVVRI